MWSFFKYNRNQFTRKLNNKVSFRGNIDINENVLIFDKWFEDTMRAFPSKKTINGQNRETLN